MSCNLLQHDHVTPGWKKLYQMTSSATKYVLHIFLEYSIQQVYKNAILQGVGGNDGMGYLFTDNKQYEFEAEILLREKFDRYQFKTYEWSYESEI